MMLCEKKKIHRRATRETTNVFLWSMCNENVHTDDSVNILQNAIEISKKKYRTRFFLRPFQSIFVLT